MGYHRAGFDVVGVDIASQPRYPFEFHQADALTFLAEHVGDFDAIHASPPCQAYSVAAQSCRNAGKHYPDLLAPTRVALQSSGRPWVMENVPGAPIRPDVKLCGCQFDETEVRRERWFETSWHAYDLRPPCHHPHPVVSVVGHGTPSWVRRQLGYNPTTAQCQAAMGIDWMTRDGLSQAIPPVYTEYLGQALIAQVQPAARSAA